MKKNYCVLLINLFVLPLIPVYSQTTSNRNTSKNYNASVPKTSPGGTSTTKGEKQTKWKVSPYDYKVFIENRGQCNGAMPNDKVLFSAELGRTNAYFTATGITFRYLEVAPIPQDKDPDEDGPPKNTMHVAGAAWVGSDEGVSVESLDKQNIYYTYDAGGNKTIKTYVFKKIVYHNLYPGIDAEYTFPEDMAAEKKCGVKYCLIVHPGADLSKVKIRYSGVSGSKMNENGDVVWAAELGELTDHAPVAYYQEDSHNMVPVSYKVNGKEESFSINSDYDKTKTLVIDPWTTSPAFTSPNTAYVMDYDYAGNVYVYGGTGYELVKIDNTGARQWMFTASTLASTGPYIGGMCCDKKSECCYMSEGWDAGGGGARQEKVNTSGFLLGTDPGNTSMNEIWRLVWDPCTHLVFGSGNGTCCPYQACQIDTNMVTETIANICAPTVSANGYHDFGCLAVDPLGGSFYTACSQSLVYTSVFNNYLVKCPIPAMVPATYQVPDQYGIKEWNSYHFSGNLTNGFSGAAVSPTWLYMYQGDTLKQINKTTGAINAVVQVSTTPYLWGGLDVDYCDDIYLGNSTTVQEYNSSLALVNSYPMTGTIYDVKVYGKDSTMYACGAGFVTATTVTPPAAPTIAKIKTGSGCSLCNGKATATLNLCGVPLNSGVTYSWSNGSTNQTDTGLCTGTYSVTITMGCFLQFTDTVNILPDSSGGLSVAASQTAGILCNGGNTAAASVTTTGGTAPYTYSWSNGKTTTGITGLTAGTYSITVNDSKGCLGVAIVNVTQPAVLTANMSSPKNESCNGDSNGSVGVTAGGGTSPYTYSWSNGKTASNNTGLSIGTYSVTVTDSNGCAATANINISQPSPLTATMGSPNNVSCNNGSNGNVGVTAGGGTTPYTYNWSNGETASNATGLTAGTYSVTVSDSSGCSATANILITQPTAVTAVMGSPTNVKCGGGNNGSASVTAGGGTPGYSYSWSNGQTSSNATGLTAGSYTVTVTDNNGCTQTATVSITQPIPVKDSIKSTIQIACTGGNTGSITIGAKGGTGGTYTYSWAPSGGTGTSATGLSAGVYTITVTDSNGCTANVTDTLKQPPVPTPGISGNDSICQGSSVTLTATGGGTYQWSPGGATSSSITVSPSSTMTYTVQVSNGTCSADTIFKVNVKPLPTVSLSASKDPICVGESATLGATGGGTYLWSPGGNTNASLTVTPPSTTTYTVKVTKDGCIKDSTIKMIVVDTPNARISITPTNCLCKGSSATLTATGGGTYMWSTGSNDSVINVSPTRDSTFYVTVDKVCNGRAKISICVDAPSFAACCDTTIQIGSSTTLSIFDGSSPNSTYLWTPSTGLSCTTCPNPVATPTVTTTYTVTYCDSMGCCTSKELTVSIACDDFTVPNVFTPNNDGINDDLVPYYTVNNVNYNGIPNLSSYSIKIYDRWGVLVYSSTDPKAYWNGRINSTNNLVADGTYYYVIDATCESNTYKKKGFVQVIASGTK